MTTKRTVLLPVLAVLALLLLNRLTFAADTQVLNIADFEDGTSGFDGEISHVTEGAQSGKGCGLMKNEKANGWVDAGKDLDDLKNDFLELRFWAKSSTADGIAVRLSDATGQEFLHRLPLKPNGEWQQLKVSDSAKASQTWGGANDKKWHAPPRHITFTLEGGKRDVCLDGVEATLNPQRITKPLEFLIPQLGHIFLTTEEVRLPLETVGENVTWKVLDYFGNTAAEGEEKVVDGRATIAPPPGRKGHFILHVVAHKDDKIVADRYTTFAAIPPTDLSAMPENPFGVMTHFAQGWDIDIMPLIAKAGIGSIRDEVYWASIEKKKGEFSIPASADRYMAEAKILGIEPLVAMTFGNKLYDGGNAPATPAGREAYARYGEELLKHFGKQIRWLEVWNEYNGSWCGGEAEKDRPKYYAEMVKVVYEKLKAVRPDVKILGCAAVVIPMPYFEGIFKNGGLPSMDAVVIHPYRGQPEGVEKETAALQELIRQHNDGKDKPIWVTETGTMDGSEYDWEAGGKTQFKGRANAARYLVRQYTLLLSTGTVEKIFWYLCRDYNEFRLMGLLGDTREPMGRYAVNAPYVAYNNLIRQLYGTQAAGRAKTGKFTYVMTFQRGEEEVRVCWATQPAHIALKTAKPVTVIDIMGEETLLTPAAGQVYLTLTDTPVYVKGKIDEVIEGGHFKLAARQTTDILDMFGFDYQIDDPHIKGTLEVDGVSLPVSGKDGRAVLTAQNTAKPFTRLLWYRLMVDGKPAGMGGVEASLVDPLSIAEVSVLPGGKTLRLRIANASKRKAYTLTSVRTKVGGKSGSTNESAPIAASQAVTLNLPMEPLTPYRSTPIAVEIQLADRASLTQQGEVSYNPCAERSIKADGDLSDWKDAPAIDLKTCGRPFGSGKGVAGKAWLAFSNEGLHLAARLPSGKNLQIAVAPTFTGAWSQQADLSGWYEFLVTPHDGNAEVRTLQAPSGVKLDAVAGTAACDKDVNETTVEALLPWSSLKPMTIEDAGVRLALMVSDDGTSGTVWGDGMVQGKTPEGFRVCPLERGAAAASNATQTQSEPLGAALSANVSSTLADSMDDYSKHQGENNWYYGFYAGDGRGKGDGVAPSGPYTDDDFQEMTHVQTPWGYTWQGTAKYNTMTPDNMHPGVEKGVVHWAVRRWKSTFAGTIRITGHFAHDRQGDGVGGKVLLDGVQVYSALAGGKAYPERIEFDVTVRVKEGSLIDFALTPGPGSNLDFDNTNFRARIAALEP